MYAHKQSHPQPSGAAETIAAFQKNWDGVTPYAVATVVHTRGATAIKAGNRVIVTDGGVLVGFTGGGCMRRALIDAGLTTIAEHAPRLIRTRPKGAAPMASDDDTIRTYTTSCPSLGEADIFLEPVLPKAPLVIIGETEVVGHLAAFGDLIGLDAILCSVGESEAEDILPLAKLGSVPQLEQGYIIVATRGVGDKVALMAAFNVACKKVLFIGSHKKADHWREQLLENGVSADALENLIAPAGKSIGAREPAEIAVAIAAQLIELRRRGEHKPT